MTFTVFMNRKGKVSCASIPLVITSDCQMVIHALCGFTTVRCVGTAGISWLSLAFQGEELSLCSLCPRHYCCSSSLNVVSIMVSHSLSLVLITQAVSKQTSESAFNPEREIVFEDLCKHSDT